MMIIVEDLLRVRVINSLDGKPQLLGESETDFVRIKGFLHESNDDFLLFGAHLHDFLLNFPDLLLSPAASLPETIHILQPTSHVVLND